jgi:hypothetical protein
MNPNLGDADGVLAEVDRDAASQGRPCEDLCGQADRADHKRGQQAPNLGELRARLIRRMCFVAPRRPPSRSRGRGANPTHALPSRKLFP